VQLSCGSEGLWRKLCAEFGFDPEAPGMATNGERVDHRAEVIALLEGAFAGIPAEELLARLAAAGIPAGKVRSIDEVYTWDQTLSQGLLIDVEHPTAWTISLPGPPLRFDDNLHAGTRTTHLPPPLLGEHDAAVRAWLDSLDRSGA
jgi:crotonobetainyl-CoA:carnitine CoA-transferase CaiB-like acyl-CoA transferase